MIYVQIASYRDPQLLPTLRDCLANAACPDELRFGIAWQHDEFEDLGEFANDPRFRVIDIPFKESRGVCWARSQVQRKYSGEKYTLAIDSHHRFVNQWDLKCIDMVERLRRNGVSKPLLTAYAPPFDPDNDPKGRCMYVTRMDFDRFIPEGAVFFLPGIVDSPPSEPIPARFLSAHFMFTVGRFCREVPYDPDYYFHGEEISLAVRAYTHGYDLFHPHEIICWHEYTRKGRTKQWDDDPLWHERNAACHERNRRLFGMDEFANSSTAGNDFGAYGFGEARSLGDYERYAGISFRRRAVQAETLKRMPISAIPKFLSEHEWESSFSKWFCHAIQLDFANYTQADYDFWCVAYHDQCGLEIYRRDLFGDELAGLLVRRVEPSVIRSEFNVFTGREPKKWVVWPHCKGLGWCERTEGIVGA